MFCSSILSFSHLRIVFPNRCIHVEATLGDQVKGRSPKKLKSLIEVPNLVQVEVHVLSFNMIVTSSPRRVLTIWEPFRSDMEDKVKVRSVKKVNMLIKDP